MKKNLLNLLCLCTLPLAGLLATPPMEAENQTGYSFSTTDGSFGLYSFALNDFKTTQVWAQTDKISAATFAEGYYYTARVNNDAPVGIFAHDMKTGESTQVMSLEGAPSVLKDMTYDYTTRTLFALADSYPSTTLLKIDLDEKTLSVVGHVESTFTVLAADAKGDLYTMTTDGSIYTLSKADASATLVYEGSEYFNYLQSLDYDFNSGKFYHLATKYGMAHLYEIDPTTWERKDIGSAAGQHIGMFSGYTTATPTSPAAPGNLTATPAANGVEQCTLTWTNPSTTFSRGTLDAITGLTIYRDGEQIATISENGLGTEVTYTDSEVTSGSHTYRVTATNASGEGMFAYVTSFIGKDLPVAPTNVVATATGEKTTTITWEAPTAGVNGGWLDAANMTYKVIRNNDNKVVAEGLSETTANDEVESYAGYTYTVIPVVPNGEGEGGVSNIVQLGGTMALPIDCTFREEGDINKFGWTIIDEDGNGKCWTRGNATSSSSHPMGIETYNDRKVDASDWLISAPVELTAGRITEVSFIAYTTYYPTERVEIRLGKGATPEDQTILIKELDLKGGYYKPIEVKEQLPAIEEDGTYYISLRYATKKDASNAWGIHINDFLWRAVDEGSVSGTVTCDGAGVEGVTVSLGDYSGTTDASGQYSIDKVKIGNYTVKATAIGYATAEQDIEVTLGGNTTCDLQITKLPTYKFSGTVTDTEGNPITGARISLSGYAPFSTVTTDGTYTLDAVYEGEYHLTIAKNNFVMVEEDVTVNSAVEKDVTLTYDNIAPLYVTADYNKNNGTFVNWAAPSTREEKFYDNGISNSPMGYKGGDELAVLGSIYREPGIVREVKWKTMPVQGKTDKVHIYIFDLDENGNPTDQMLYSVTDVPTVDNEWNTFILPRKVVAENGFYLALSGQGQIALAIDDGTNNKWADNKRTQCYNINYRATYDYRYIDDTSNPSRCFLLRAVCEEIEPDNATQPNIEYNVWRIADNKQDIEDESAWTLVAEAQKGLSVIDNKATSGTYVYAVKAIYPVDNLTSEATFSNSVNVNTSATVTINVTANSAKEHANGAKVTLAGIDDEYTATVAGNKAVFNDVKKGEYSVTITLNGFENVRERGVKFEGEETEFSRDYTLTQKLDLARNIDILATENPETWNLVWNAQPNLSDDFEGNEYEDFTINPAGNIGWQYIDNDSKVTFGFGNTTFPNMREKMAAILFNSSTTTPPLGINTANSGYRCLGFFAARESENEEGGIILNESDDYFISPLLNPYQDFKFSFWARTYEEATGYRERIRVGYSTTTADIKDFIWFDELEEDSNDPADPDKQFNYVPMEYTKYEYSIPKEAKYVVLNSHSLSNFILLVDDVFIGVDGQVTGCEYAPVNVEKYEVYLDGQMVTETTDNNYTFENVPAGKHTAAIVQVFATGKSPKLEIEFGEGGSTANALQTEGIDAYVANGILYIEGNYQHAELFNVAGVKMMEASGNRTTDVTSLVDGVYVLKVTTANGITSKKLVIE